MASSWQPTPDGLQQLMQILQGCTSSDATVRRQNTEALQSFERIPDFNNYLAYILTHVNTPDIVTTNIRTTAGLALKNNARVNYETIPAATLEYVKYCVLNALADPVPAIRGTAGTIITTLIARGSLTAWPEILPKLMECIQHPVGNIVEGAFGALQKICEDSARALNQDTSRPLDFMIPKFIQCIDHSSIKVRVHAIICINQFILLRANALVVNIDGFVQKLYGQVNTNDPELRKSICQAITYILEIKPESLMAEFNNVVQFMLYCTQSDDETVALEACEFWLAFAEQEGLVDFLEPLLPQIVPVLLKGMVYGDEDIILLGGDKDDDASVPDADHEIRPRHHKAKTKIAAQAAPQQQQPQQTQKSANGVNNGGSAEGEEDDDEDEDWDEDDDDDDSYGEWNLRKCSAAALDVLATVFSDKLLVTLLPLLKGELFSDKWERRECGILALGAVAEGCMAEMEKHLPTLIPYLITLLNDPKPLVRSITCWTLGRYSRWTVHPSSEVNSDDHQRTYFHPLVEGLLAKILDKNKRVQEAGCSAFATLEEEATTELVPFLETILRTLAYAFQTYQHKNLLILYDAVGTLGESVGHYLNRPEYIEILMPPLISFWQKLGDDDRDIFPLLECLSSVATALGTGFLQFAGPVIQRCLTLIQGVLQQEALHRANPHQVEAPDKDFMIVALDLLSGMTQGLGEQIEPFVANSNPPLVQLLAHCMSDPAAEVKQSAFALLGDLAISCFSHIRPHLNQFLPMVINHVDPNADAAWISVCNNATWATGEIALKYGAEMQQWIQPLLERLIPILVNDHTTRTLLENAAITIGRLGYVAPTLVAPHLPQFLPTWCTVSRSIKDNQEKESAFRGLCRMAEANPQGVVQHFVYFCDALCLWEHVPPELNEMFKNILTMFRNVAGCKNDTSHLEKAKERYKVHADASRRQEVELRVGEEVMISTKNVGTERPTKKKNKWIGPYHVKRKINQVTYEIEVPSSIRIHPVVHISLLKKYIRPKDPSKQLTKAPPIKVNPEEEWVIKDILDVRRRGRGFEYYIDWEGFGPESRTWEPRWHLNDDVMLREWHARNPEKIGPFANVAEITGGDNVTGVTGVLSHDNITDRCPVGVRQVGLDDVSLRVGCQT
ncbi:hypothetical protein SeMB42_g05170 [Synchytrium endobioticum]|uniref:Chromo domain-containing protein n=1 Tax=Synchytrium endobioticum TaxID=286115 RepID=A0A507CT34_9FUNG|nr:hypothetical protein SeMB42_g05170 [Synchytrium endobioticum]